MTGELLRLFQRVATRRQYLDAVVELVKRSCGCECVGIRMDDREGNLAYEAQSGFDRRFLEREGSLRLETADCVCARTVLGTALESDRPCLSPSGSFGCNDTQKFAAALGPYPVGSLVRLDNNEIGFSADNLYAITYAAASTKIRRKAAATYIGGKGIGFKSVFAQMTGYKFKKQERDLERFDDYFYRNGYSGIRLTKPMTDGFIYGPDYEKPSTHYKKEVLLSSFAEFLIRQGIPVYVPPVKSAPEKRCLHIPYIFSNDELRRFFLAIDRYPRTTHTNRNMIDPLLFRLLYGSGFASFRSLEAPVPGH